MKTLDYLSQYYENYDEEGRLATPYGKVEFLTTMRYIHRYLVPGMRIIEIGAGTGRYSRALSQEGYSVDAVELVEHNIQLFQKQIQPGQPVTIAQGNALDLFTFPDNSYDITLLLGPMYHLFTREEQQKALSEAIRVTKPGGILFVSYCMGDASVLTYGFIRGHIQEILEKCMLDPETFDTFSNPWDIFALYRKENIDALRQQFPVTQLHFIATDGYANHMRETLAQMDENVYQLYLKYHFSTSERQDMVGLSHHTLYVLRKERV